MMAVIANNRVRICFEEGASLLLWISLATFALEFVAWLQIILA